MEDSGHQHSRLLRHEHALNGDGGLRNAGHGIHLPDLRSAYFGKHHIHHLMRQVCKIAHPKTQFCHPTTARDPTRARSGITSSANANTQY